MYISIQNAKQIGAKLTLNYASVGLLIAYSIFSILANSFLWILDIPFLPSILIGILMVWLSSYFIGKYAVFLIIDYRFNKIIVGIFCAFLIAIFSTFIASLYMFLIEANYANYGFWNEFNSYVINPIIAIFIVGLIPNLILEILLGLSFKRNLK